MYIKLNDIKTFYSLMDIPTIITDFDFKQVYCNNAAEDNYLGSDFNPGLCIEATPGAAELINDNRPAVLLRFEASDSCLAITATPIGPYIVFQQSNSPGTQPDIKMVYSDIESHLDRIFTLLPTLVKFGSGDRFTLEGFERIHRSCFAILRTVQNSNSITDLVSNCNLNNQTFNVTTVLKGIADACNEACINLPEQVPVHYVGNTQDIFVTCDKEKFITAILNLIVNSMVYTKDDNLVKIECSELGNKVVIMMSDKGMGISAEHLNRLQLPYNSKHPYDDEPGVPGLGVGLTLVKEFAARYNGSFSIESEQHEYTKTFLTLPIQAQHGASSRQDQRAFASLIKHRFSPLYVQLSLVCNPSWGENLFKDQSEFID